MTPTSASEYIELQKQTRLNVTRPAAHLELTAPRGYRTLLQHIEVHRYYLGLDCRRPVSLEEAAAHWYDTVYLSMVEAIRATGMPNGFPGRTEPDLYLWVAYHREQFSRHYGYMPPDEHVAKVLKERHSGRPVLRLIKSVRRVLQAAVAAAAESPEAPRSSSATGRTLGE